MSSQKTIVLKPEEMHVLSAAAGIKEYYGMAVSDQELMEKEDIYELLFQMVKKKLLKVSDQIELEKPMDMIFSIMKTAVDIIIVYPRNENCPTTCYYCGQQIVKAQSGSTYSGEMKLTLLDAKAFGEELASLAEGFYQNTDREKEEGVSDFDGSWEDGWLVAERESCLLLIDRIEPASGRIQNRLMVARQGLFDWLTYQGKNTETMLYDQQGFTDYLYRMIGGGL